MSKITRFLIRLAFSTAFVVLVFGSHKIAAQTVLTGNWEAEIKTDKPDKIKLSFERYAEKGYRKRDEQNYSFAEFQGLSEEQAAGSDTVNFRLVREAGSIECTGKFTNGKGAGTFRFTANQSFISAMKERGFDFEEKPIVNDGDEPANTLFAATTLNLTTAFVDDLKSANFGHLKISDLFLARVVNLTSQYKREMGVVGFPNEGFRDLVNARLFNLDADYIKQIRALGFREESFQDLIHMRTFNVTPEFIRAVRGEGFLNLSSKDLINARIFSLDADYIRQIRALGFQNENFQTLINLRTFNVTPEFINEVRREGLTDVSAKELVNLKIYNIDGEFIRRAKAEKDDLSVANLIRRALSRGR